MASFRPLRINHQFAGKLVKKPMIIPICIRNQWSGAERVLHEHHRFTFFNRRALLMTETELKVIAALAIMGLNNNPKNGYSTPAAIGTPMQL